MVTDTLHLADMNYKDADPMSTVQRIRDILKAHQIQVTERWNDSKVPHCYSIRISVDGCGFAVNGKGLTRELTLASGYGELMERLQLGYLGNTQSQKTGNQDQSVYSTTVVNAQTIYNQNPDRYVRIADRASQNIGHQVCGKDALLSLAEKDGTMKAVPFVELSSGNKTLFPEKMLNMLYSTNGCAAGNTLEEAIVQAISEVVERHHHIRIMDERIYLPDIPESVLKRYPVAYHIITFLRGNGFRVLVRDASLGTGFPVVCVYIINTKNGKYHTHFGAYPIFEIALARTLTESFQGRTIDEIAQFDGFYERAVEGYDIGRNTIEFVKGTWKKPKDFFVGQCAHSFDPEVGFSGEDNRALLRQCLDMFRKKGLEVLVRDSSALGFPTCQVIVPGYSEIFAYRLEWQLNERRYAAFVRRAISDPCAAQLQDFVGVAKHMVVRQNYELNQIGKFGFRQYTGAQLDITEALDCQLAYYAFGYTYYILNQLSSARKYVEMALALGNCEQEAYLSCLCRYLRLVERKSPASEIRQILEFFHEENAVSQLYNLLERGENLFVPLVLRCGPEHCELCPLKERCNSQKIQSIHLLIQDAVRQLDIDTFCEQIRQLTAG